MTETGRSSKRTVGGTGIDSSEATVGNTEIGSSEAAVDSTEIGSSGATVDSTGIDSGKATAANSRNDSKSRDKSEKKKKLVQGSLGLENRLTAPAEENAYDEAGKAVLQYKEVLANIVKYGVPEYKNYEVSEIMDFIEVESITSKDAIAPDATAPDSDTRITGDNTVQNSVREANLTFDVLFQILHPDRTKVHLHVDVELQGNYYPGYPLEKRGIYHLSRMISSQLDIITKKSNYDKLEKACSIFICVGNVPKYLMNTVSYYKFANTENIGDVKPNPEHYDLMELIIVRIGDQSTKPGSKLVHFLHGLFYNTEEVKEYIDFSQNEKLRKEMSEMAITGEHLIVYGREQERENTEKERKRAEEAVKQADQERNRADQERQRAEEEKQRAEQALRKVEEEKQRAEEEKNRADETEQKLKQALAELEQLKNK